MTSIRGLEFLIFLLCHHVYGELPDPVFRTKDSNIELGYCFGVDYILVYRSSPEGYQLLGNSSESLPPVTPPADLQSRIHITQQEFLLGLQIVNLRCTDSAIYRKECWHNQTLVSWFIQQLFVCDEEVESEVIKDREDEKWTELLCDSASVGMEGISVRWYEEAYPSYKTTLILDSSVSLEPLVEELKNRTKVRDNGFLLLIDSALLNNNQQYYCLVIKDKNCLTFQNMYLPVQSWNVEIYASAGDKVVLHCPSDGHNQQWDTPLGNINGSNVTKTQLHVREKDFSLVIPSVSDKHTGHFSCISSSLEVQYSLVLCPKKKPLPPQTVVKGQDVKIECDVDQENQRVLWFRNRLRQHIEEQILDSKNTTSPPGSESDRLSLSQSGSSLIITHAEMDDGGMYSCVVLREPDFILLDYDIDYSDNLTVEEDYDADPELEDSYSCIFKQSTTLTVVTEPIAKPKAEPKAEPTNLTPHILGAGLAGLVLLVGVIVTVIIVKRKTRNRNAAEHTNNTEDPSSQTLMK